MVKSLLLTPRPDLLTRYAGSRSSCQCSTIVPLFRLTIVESQNFPSDQINLHRQAEGLTALPKATTGSLAQDSKTLKTDPLTVGQISPGQPFAVLSVDCGSPYCIRATEWSSRRRKHEERGSARSRMAQDNAP